MPTSNREEALFAAVLEKPTPAERAAYLEGACGDDHALRQRMEALLAAHEASGGVLDSPPSIPTPTAAYRPLTEGPGTLIGPYKLLQQIGEGGMGVVYMAEQQEPVRRKVALKIIKPGMDSHQVIARFEAERQALAMMDHQNIARVLDAGTTDSARPYFVMELVHGVPITQFCDDNQLTPRERLQLFVPVCQAIQHAHQKGIIHRDVKPSNVLVTMYDDKPVPKVIDFGVAKAIEQRLTEKTLFTQFGTLVGTFEYMSPEQAEMNAFGVDTRSDVYSLGVLLYELLTGTPPLERERLRKAALNEVVRLIREEEAQRPSARLSSSGNLPKIAAARKMEPERLTKLVRGELDWIVMRCLEKNRTRRYETASALGRDVERYLHDESVEACPPSVRYRVSKLARKNWVVLTTAAAFMAFFALAAGVSTYLAVFANERREEAEKAGKQAGDERDRADKKAIETRQALDRLSVEQGLRLAENDDLFTAVLWFARPLERGGLSAEDDRIHRTRFACYLRHTHGRPVLRQMFFHEGEVKQLAFSPNAAELLTVTEEGASVWDLPTGRKVATLERSKDVAPLQFMDGKRVSGQGQRVTLIWDTTTGRLLDSRVMDSEAIAQTFLFALPQSPWQALGSIGLLNAYADPEARKVNASSNGRLHLRMVWNHAWLCDVSTGKLLHHWFFPGLDHINGEFSPDAAHVLVSTAKWARVYDVKTGNPIGPALTPGGEIIRAQSSSDGSRVLLKASNRVSVWDTIAGKQTGPTALSTSEGLYLSGFLSPDGRIVAVSEGWGFPLGARFTLWDTEEGRLIALQADKREEGRVCFSPDGCNVITTGKDRTDELWDVRTGQPAGPLLPNFGHDTDYQFSQDGSMVAVAHGDGIVRVWHLAGYRNGARETRSQASDLPHAIARATCSFHNQQGESRHYSIPRDNFHKNLSELPELLKVLPPSVHAADVSAAASPDGHRLVTVALKDRENEGSTALLWDARAGRLLGQPIVHPDRITHVEFTADSRFLVTASNSGPARLFDARTGVPVGSPLLHGEGVEHARFAEDGRRLVTVSTDGTAQVWDTATANPIGSQLRHADLVNAAALSPDGRLVATASSDGTARIWDAATGQPIGHALTYRHALHALMDIAFDSHGRFLLTQEFREMFDGAPGCRIWDAATQQEVSPWLHTPRYGAFCATAMWAAEGLFVPPFREKENGWKYDLSADQRPAEDLVKFAQLHSGQRLDDQGNLTPLTKVEIQALWNELRAKYPEEFTVRPDAVLAWHEERSNEKALRRK